MDDFLERLRNEQSELNEKAEKLEAFISSDKFNSVDWIQRDLLDIQLQSMKTYSKCLEKRLVRLEQPKEAV